MKGSVKADRAEHLKKRKLLLFGRVPQQFHGWIIKNPEKTVFGNEKKNIYTVYNSSFLLELSL